MTLPRLSIARWMLVVVVIALNFGCLRALSAYHPILPVAVALMAFALQAGVVGLYHIKDGRRPFLVGFLAFGAIAMATAVWGLVFAPSMGLAYDAATGRTTKVIISGSPLWSLWGGYVGFVVTFLDKQLAIPFDPVGFLACVIWALPQFAIALVGGFLTQSMARSWGKGSAVGSSVASPQPRSERLLSAKM